MRRSKGDRGLDTGPRLNDGDGTEEAQHGCQTGHFASQGDMIWSGLGVVLGDDMWQV